MCKLTEYVVIRKNKKYILHSVTNIRKFDVFCTLKSDVSGPYSQCTKKKIEFVYNSDRMEYL
jgi:hypothetical protein